MVKAFGKESLEVKRFSGRNTDLLRVDIGLGKLQSIMFPFLGYIMTIGSFIVWGFGGWDVASGKIPLRSAYNLYKLHRFAVRAPGVHDQDS